MSDVPDIPPPPRTLPIPDEEELPLASFEGGVCEYLRRLQENGRAFVLMEGESAEAVVLDVDAYERLAEALEEADTIIRLQRGLLQGLRGEGRPFDDVFAEIRTGTTQR